MNSYARDKAFNEAIGVDMGRKQDLTPLVPVRPN